MASANNASEHRACGAATRLALDLDGAPGSTRRGRTCARGFLDALADQGLLPAGAAADTILVTSELMANATRHAPGPCRQTLDASRDAVTVHDTSPAPPRRTHPSVHGGYGLLIVDALTTSLHTPHTRR
ncbi:ATP-binding protein [Yinghuangia aomiensis]|uniref:ATP-binding protein n=1 Tax=Yinghuangia aomiensis TaxID=676205 RepID=A0ABP9H6Z5_9ACTN